MRESVENHVRTIVAQTLRADPDHIRPETLLRRGDIGLGKIFKIASRIELNYGISFDITEIDRWTSVADLVIATETAIEKSAAIIAQRKPAAA